MRQWSFYAGRVRFAGPISGPISGLLSFLATLLSERLTERRVRPLSALLSGLLVTVLYPIATNLAHQAWYQVERYLMLRRLPRELREDGRPYGMPPDMPRELVELLRVVPIAQSQASRNASIQMLSLEVYAEGAVLNTRVLSNDRPGEMRGPFPFDVPRHAHPELQISASDDRGGTYPLMPQGGSGGDAEWRQIYQMTRSLDPLARELRIEVGEILWSTFGPLEGAERHELEQGPWIFQVPL